MNFLVRAVTRADVQPLFELARQFTLLNLPADVELIAGKVERSLDSFAGRVAKSDALYMFVAEDRRSGAIVGSSLILAKNATATHPNFIFKVLRQNYRSRGLGLDFEHQKLRLIGHTDGPTEVGGLVVDRAHRRHPERVGRMISLSRFVYIGMHPERFENELHAEMTLAEGGASAFWDALGRRFTGMSYDEADRLSARDNSFIPELFPPDDIHLALVSPEARAALGRVGSETGSALRMLEKIGFKFKDEVDPFDGGPHLGCRTQECTLIKNLTCGRIVAGVPAAGLSAGLVALSRPDGFRGTWSDFTREGDVVRIPETTRRLLEASTGEPVYIAGDNLP